MKKKATVLIASIMAFCGINTAHADEGMWTIYNLPNAVYEMMQRDHIPALAEGALEMKYPNTPRHPRQQYRMTKQAKTWKEWNEKKNK